MHAWLAAQQMVAPTNPVASCRFGIRYMLAHDLFRAKFRKKYRTSSKHEPLIEDVIGTLCSGKSGEFGLPGSIVVVSLGCNKFALQFF